MNLLVRRPGRERGQAIVLFSLVLVAIVAMTGLVLDGGGTFVQRREQQNVADSASMAGAYAYVNSGGDASQATAAAKSLASQNGYADATNGVTVTVTVASANPGTTVTVTVNKPHQNFFSGVVGFSSWGVSTTATAITGAPNAVAGGAMPIIFNQKAVSPGSAKSYDEPGTGPQDVPQGSTQFNWTVFCTANGNPCNANTDTVKNLIDGYGKSQDVYLGMAIGPLNAGDHTALFSDLANSVGLDFPVAIVDDSGKFVGVAVFHLTGSVGGSTKQISGYFLYPTNAVMLRIRPGGPAGSSQFGGYVVQLVN